jgi:hypothetical protein
MTEFLEKRLRALFHRPAVDGYLEAAISLLHPAEFGFIP